MHEHIVLKTIVKILLPFIIMYALYVQAHGEYSPGGGFQAGIILAVGFIAYSFTHDLESLQKIMPVLLVQLLAASGVVIYAGVGVVTMLMGANFLNYSVLLLDKAQGQKLGIMVVELGVGITVFAVIMLIFYSFGGRSGNDD
jgi:multicomponent Na+:H+ antiporter subunit B